MAEEFEKTVIISLEATLKGIRGALDALKNIEELSDKASSSISALEGAESDLGKALASTTKHVAKYNKSLGATKKIQKGLYETARGAFGLVSKSIKLAVGAAAAYLIETKRIGDTMLNLQVQSLGAAGALDRLSSAYSSFADSSGSASVSLKDMASSLAKFRSQGIAEMATGLDQSFTEGFIGMQNALTKVLGKSGASAQMEKFYKSMDGEFLEFRTTMRGNIRNLTLDLSRARDAGDNDKSIAALDALQIEMKRLMKYTSDGGVVAREVANTFDALGSALKGDNPSTRGLIAMNDAMAVLGTIMTEFHTNMLEIFGNDMGDIMDALRKKLKEVGLTAKGLTEYVYKLHKKFESLDGVNVVITKLNSLFDETWAILKDAAKAAEEFVIWFTKSGGAKAILQTMKSLASTLVSVVKWFLDAGHGAKMLSVAVLAIAFSPGLSTGLASLVGGFKDASIWAQKTTAATRKLNEAAVAAGKKPTATARGGKVVGAATGAVTAVAGHFGGRALAKGAGADEHGAASILAGAGGAAVGGAQAGMALGGPAGAAIGVVVAGLGSIVVSGIQAWRADVKEALQIKDSFNEVVKSSKSMTRELQKNARGMSKFAVSDLQQLEARGAEILAQKAVLQDKAFSGKVSDESIAEQRDALDKELDKIAGEKRELGGFKTNVIDVAFEKRITEQEKLRAAAIEKSNQGGDAGLEATRELKGIKKTIKQLIVAGKVQSEINRLLKERKEILSKKGTMDDEKLAAALEDVQDKIDKYQSDLGVIEIEIKPKIVDDHKPLTEFEKFKSAFKDLSEFEGTLPAFAAGVGGVMKALNVLGPASEQFGDALGNIVQEQASRQLDESARALEASGKRAKQALEGMVNAESTGDALRWQKEFVLAVNISEQATQGMVQSLEGMLAPLDASLKKIRASKDLRQLDLDISQKLYGAPGLAVQAQLAYIDAQQQEKEVLEAKLAITRQEHAEAKVATGSSGDILSFKLKELELSKEIKQVTSDQLSQVKELRDGYLDAIQAQALGAGRFSKIILTQEANVGKALGQRAFKDNFLLGGVDPTSPKADSAQFSATGGYGAMKGADGGPLDLEKISQQRIDKMPADAQAAAQLSKDVTFGAMRETSKDTKSLGLVMSHGTDRTVDAINSQTEQLMKTGVKALKGTPAGTTAVGVKVDEQMKGMPDAKKEKAITDNVRATTARQLKQIQQLKAGGGGAGGVPMLTAVDTDTFMGRKGAANASSRYGARSGFIGRKNKTISELDEKIKNVSSKILPGSTLMGPRQETVGPIAPRILAKQDRERKQQDSLMRKKAVLEKARKNQQDALHKVKEAVDRPLREQAERAAQASKLRSAGLAAAGLGYTGAAPKRVQGATLPTDVLPAGAMGPTAPGQTQQLSGVSNAAGIRTLSHGAPGSSKNEVQSELQKAAKALSKAANAAGEMGPPDPGDESGRTNYVNYVQSITP